MIFVTRYMRKIIISALLLLSPLVTFAQPEEGEKLDEIVAVVGKEIIMKSDVTAQIAMLAQVNPSVDISDPDLRDEVLNSIINEKLVVTKALEDSVTVTEEEIEQRWDVLLENLISQYGSRNRIEKIYGMSINRLKYQYREEIRKNLLSNKLKQQRFQDISVSPKEVEEFFEIYKDSLQAIPPQVELYHIVRYVQAENVAKEEAYELAKKVRDTIIAEDEFAEFAERYSGDPATAKEGGDLGWFEKGKLFPEYEQAAFALQPGEISIPVETPFGFHLIQTIEKDENRIKTRHILFKIGQSSKDVEKTKQFLSSLKDSIKAGQDFETLAKKYSEDKETRGFGGFIGKVTLDEMPSSVREIISKLDAGDVSEPIPYDADRSKPAYHIIYIKRFIESHMPDLENDFKFLEKQAKNYKQMQEYQDWVKELREELYWEIKK